MNIDRLVFTGILPILSLTFFNFKIFQVRSCFIPILPVNLQRTLNSSKIYFNLRSKKYYNNAQGDLTEKNLLI